MSKSMTHWSDKFTGTACDAGIKEARQYETFADWWAGGENGEYMIRALYEIGYDDQRALRLLAVRFVRETTLSDGRTVWDLLEDERSREAVIVAERYVNGEASGDRLTEVWTAAREVAAKAGRTVGEGAEAIAWAAQAAKAATGAVWTEVWTAPWAAALGAAWASASAAAWTAAGTRAWTAAWTAAWASAWTATAAQHAAIIREMIPASEIEPLVNQYIEPALL